MPQWPPPPQVIFVLVLMGLVLLAGVTYGLLSLARFLAFYRAGVSPFEDDDGDMSSYDAADVPENHPVSIAATRATTQQQPIAIQQNERNALLLQAKAEALAAMVEAGAITETKGLQIVFGVRPSSTNPRYLEARAALHAELAKRHTPVAGRPTAAHFASDKVAS